MGITVKKVSDPEFGAYGKVLEGYDISGLMEKMRQTPLPEAVIYVPSVPELESDPAAAEIACRAYGQLPVQLGYCNGHNQRLNALEYHRDSEVNIAVTDLVLLIGKQQDITADWTYDTSKVEAFLVPSGTVIEVYATTLHYAPCHVTDEGFRCMVILPKGTNTDLAAFERKTQEDRLLFARNKWLIGHEDGGLPEEAYIGLAGDNLSL